MELQITRLKSIIKVKRRLVFQEEKQVVQVKVKPKKFKQLMKEL